MVFTSNRVFSTQNCIHIENYSQLNLVKIESFSTFSELLRNQEFQRFRNLPKLQAKSFDETISALANLTTMGLEIFFKKEIKKGIIK